MLQHLASANDSFNPDWVSSVCLYDAINHNRLMQLTASLRAPQISLSVNWDNAVCHIVSHLRYMYLSQSLCPINRLKLSALTPTCWMQEIALLSRHNNLFSLLHLSLYIIYNRRESDSNDTKYIIIFMLATAWARGLALSPSLIGCCCNSIKITARWFFKCHKNRENSLLKKRETERQREREWEKYT